ncbi:MAG: hypothetical protein ACU85U_01760 [Gammaproteobacteria bacterium]
MERRTPLVAIMLAPLVLILAAAAWQKLITPAYHRVRLSDPMLEWRPARADPQARLAALQTIAPRVDGTQLIAVVVSLAAPAILAIAFPVYIVARGLTRSHEHRWRALAAIPVLAVWGSATWALIMLLFTLAHAGDSPGKNVKLAAIVWSANAV